MRCQMKPACHTAIAVLASVAFLMGYPGNSKSDAAAGKPILVDSPGVLDQPGATYLLTRDVTAPRTAFMINADGITLDLGGHTVTYGTEIGIDRCCGVFLRGAGAEDEFRGVPREGFGGANGFTLRNGRILQGRQPVAPEGAITYSHGRLVKETGDHPRPGRSCVAAYIRDCHGLSISNITTEVNSRDTDNIYIRDCADVRIQHCVFISHVREITNRHYPGTGLITLAGVRGAMEVDHNLLHGGGQWGIRVSAPGRTGPLILVHHNIIRHRSRTTNGYAIACHAPNMRVYANVIKSIGRGVHLTANNIDFYNNIVEPRERPNPEYPRTRTHGIKLEYCSNSAIHHNLCRVIADEGFGDASPLDFSVHDHSANRVFKNTIIALRNTTTLDAYSVNLVDTGAESLTRVYENTFLSNHIHIRGDWGGASGVMFERNRFEVVGRPADYRFLYLWQSRAVMTRHTTLRDNEFVPPADEQNIHMLYAASYTPAHVDVAVERTVTVKVTDPAGLPLAGIPITACATDRDDVVDSGITDDSGNVRLVLIDYRIVGNEGKSPIRKHGPYVITAPGHDWTETLDATRTLELTAVLRTPGRKLYAWAGDNQRREIGEIAELSGRVVVDGDPTAKPSVTWRYPGSGEGWPIADAKALSTTAKMTRSGEYEIALEAAWGDETVTDKVQVRTDKEATPVAVVVCPPTARVNTIVQLDATQSRDPRGFREQHEWKWKQVSGPASELASDELADPIFFPTEPGTYAFEVVFSSPIRSSVPAVCRVVVSE